MEMSTVIAAAVWFMFINALGCFFFAFTMTTRNFKSAMTFQYIPFLLGCGSLFFGLKFAGWI